MPRGHVAVVQLHVVRSVGQSVGPRVSARLQQIDFAVACLEAVRVTLLPVLVVGLCAIVRRTSYLLTPPQHCLCDCRYAREMETRKERHWNGRGAPTMRLFDDTYIAPMMGCANGAAQYYRCAASGPLLHRIRFGHNLALMCIGNRISHQWTCFVCVLCVCVPPCVDDPRFSCMLVTIQSLIFSECGRTTSSSVTRTRYARLPAA